MKNSTFKINRKMKVSIVGMVIEGFLSGSIFLVLFAIIDLNFGTGVTIREILMLSGLVAFIFTLRLLIYCTAYTGSQINGAVVSKNIRISIGDKLKRIPLSLFTKNRTGFYINAATSEVSDYEQILTHKLALIIQLSLLLLMIGVYACTLHLVCGLVILCSSFLLIPSAVISIRIVKKYGTQKNLAREKNVSAITEYLIGSQTLRSYGLVGKKNKAVTQVMREYSNISYHYEKATLPTGFIFNFCSFIAMALTIVIAVKSWIVGLIDVPDLVMLIMLPTFTATVNMTLFINTVAFRNLILSKEKLCGILDEKEEVPEKDSFAPKNTTIKFKNVNFSYVENEPVLKSANFTIPEGQLTAIVGDSGSGKSTILNLITKYYEPQSGSITIGGFDTKDVPAEQVLSYISMVDQDVFLFNDSVRNNIRYARPDATDKEIKHACYLANCHTFISSMTKGYDTEIGENGNYLSGGERQRLSIARAILRDAPIILLDEATASLDIENELLVKQAITHLLKADKTVVMIAHTMPIIKNADKILVVECGAVVESGTHDILVEKGGKYSSMWKASSMLN